MAKKKFEKSLEELEEIVDDLEGGDIPLDEALQNFEKGIKLVKSCHQVLEEAEKKIEKLMAFDDGSFETEDFDPDEPDKKPKRKKAKKKVEPKVVEDDQEDTLF